MFIYHTIYLLTCRVLLEKLAGLQLVKKFPAFYGTRRFITTFTSFRHPSLSWASPIQSPYPQPTSCRSILILSTHLRLGLCESCIIHKYTPWVKCSLPGSRNNYHCTDEGGILYQVLLLNSTHTKIEFFQFL